MLFQTYRSPMRVTSTVDAYMALGSITDAPARQDAWVSEYEAAHRDIFDVYYQSWSTPERRAQGVEDVPLIAPDVRRLEERALALAAQTEKEFQRRALVDELDLVLMVGNHTSNGWVAEIQGRESLFLALEFLGDPPFDGVLVSHEALHLAHLKHGAAGWPDDVGALLIQEGLATAVARELHPGLTDSGYLWTDDKHDFWVQQCSDSGRDITSMVLEEITTSADEPNVRGLFAADSQARALPSRSGYWLGDRLTQRWLAAAPLQEVLEWDHPEAVRRAQTDLRFLIT